MTYTPQWAVAWIRAHETDSNLEAAGALLALIHQVQGEGHSKTRALLAEAVALLRDLEERRAMADTPLCCFCQDRRPYHTPDTCPLAAFLRKVEAKP